MTEIKGKRGITLVALIITIIVLLILAVVAIRAISNDGIISHAKNARKDYTDATQKEEDLLRYYEGILDTQEVVPTTDELQGKYEFAYYTTLSKAIEDVNQGATNPDSTKSEAVAGVYKDEKNNAVIVLLKNTEESAKLTINKNAELNLGGNVLKLTTNDAEIYFAEGTTATVNGMLKGSKIEKNTNGDASIAPKLINTEGENINIKGGEYVCGISNTTSGCLPIKIKITNEFNIRNCKIYSENSGQNATGIQIEANNTNIENSAIEVNSPNGGALGIRPTNNSTVQIKGTTVKTTSVERKFNWNSKLWNNEYNQCKSKYKLRKRNGVWNSKLCSKY